MPQRMLSCARKLFRRPISSRAGPGSFRAAGPLAHLGRPRGCLRSASISSSEMYKPRNCSSSVWSRRARATWAAMSRSIRSNSARRCCSEFSKDAVTVAVLRSTSCGVLMTLYQQRYTFCSISVNPIRSVSSSGPFLCTPRRRRSCWSFSRGRILWYGRHPIGFRQAFELLPHLLQIPLLLI